MASLSRQERQVVWREELPWRVKQLSHSLEGLAQLVYHQLPFARADNESVETYKQRITEYFDKLFAVERELLTQLSEEDRVELGEAIAKVDVHIRESLLEMENAKFEPTQEELLEHYQLEEQKFEELAERLGKGGTT